MGIGVSIFLLAAGAIVTFAVDHEVDGVDLDGIGIILMLVGGLGLLFTLLVWGDRTPLRTRRDYVDDDVAPRTRVVDEPVVSRTVVEDDPVVSRRSVSRRSASYR